MSVGRIVKTEWGVCIDNFKASGVREGKYGLALIVNDSICKTAGVFTTNRIKSASVMLDKKRIDNGFQAIVINSGNANSCVKDGLRDAEEICKMTAKRLNINERNVGIASTGIIGKRLNMELIEILVDKACKLLSNSSNGSKNAARAIMTTDTKMKELSIEYNGIKIGGIAKGAGMIAPDLATMLCFLTTNANLSRYDLQNALEIAVDESFNMLVIDNDMSTNDTVLLMSNGKKKCTKDDFQYALNYITKEFARMIASDGEGVTKFMEVEVKGAKSRDDARNGAKAIVSSSLVKSAIHGENPNWGRIAAALGSKVNYEFENIDIIFETCGKNKRTAVVIEGGEVNDLKGAREVLKNDNFRIIVDLHSGEERAVAFGCDLSPEYIHINAEYN